jgi:glycosyltransferase involved in cell wall biosynthesis
MKDKAAAFILPPLERIPMQRIVIVGSHPPPHAGNSVHIEKLRNRLVADGFPVTVIDPYNRQALIHAAEGGEPHAVRAQVRQGFWAIGRYLHAHSQGAVVHVHMSAGKRFYGVAALLLALTRRARKRVLTVHSGSFLKVYDLLGPFRRHRALRIMASFDDVICVNELQREHLQTLVPCRLHVIPAFLPTKPCPNFVLPPSVRELQRQADVIVVTSGSGEKVYDYRTVLRGVELAQKSLRERLGLIVATYKTWDKEYWPPVEQELRRSRLPLAITRSLSPEEFMALMTQARIYVRATLADGDAMAIREAASMGMQILATDAVPRPVGTALFPTGNAEQLGARLVQAVKEPTVGQLPLESTADLYQSILNVYGVNRLGAKAQPTLHREPVASQSFKGRYP